MLFVFYWSYYYNLFNFMYFVIYAKHEYLYNKIKFRYKLIKYDNE